MSVKITKIKGLAIDPGKGNAFAYETPEHMPKAHQNCLVVGPRGSGKTVATVNLVENMGYDRVFIISPSVASNKNIMDRLRIDPDDVYAQPNAAALAHVKQKIEQIRDEYEEFLEKLERWKAFMHKLKHSDDTQTLFSDDMVDFFDGREFVKPIWKYGMKDGKARLPMLALILDDCVGSELYTRGIRQLNAFTIFHRHLGQLHGKEGGAIGCSLYFLCQCFKCSSGGISKCIRNNTTSMIIFHTKSEKELDEISDECNGEVSKQDFMKLYDTAMVDKHSFLFIDLHKKEHHPSGFRRNLDEFLTIPQPT